MITESARVAGLFSQRACLPDKEARTGGIKDEKPNPPLDMIKEIISSVVYFLSAFEGAENEKC